MDPRAEIIDLLARCRQDPGVPESLFRLLEAVVSRLDHAFPAELPTKPDRRTPSPFQAVAAILNEALDKPKQSP